MMFFMALYDWGFAATGTIGGRTANIAINFAVHYLTIAQCDRVKEICDGD